MARCLAEAWAEHNIRINTICPGLNETDMGHLMSPVAKERIIANSRWGTGGLRKKLLLSLASC